MDLSDQLALSDDEEEGNESVAVIAVGADEVINKTRVPGITLSELPAQFHIDYDSADERFDSEDDENVDCEDNLGSAIFNLGNYCHQMLQVHQCHRLLRLDIVSLLSRGDGAARRGAPGSTTWPRRTP